MVYESIYVQEAVRIYEEYAAKHLRKGYKLLKRADYLFKSGYCPEMDVSPVLGSDKASYYQSLIGVMRWIIEIGHIDFNIKVSLLSSHSAMPREGLLEAKLHIMGYLKLRHYIRLAFDPSCPNINHSNFWEFDWIDFYEGAVEAIPPNAQLWRRKEVDLYMFIDSNLAGKNGLGDLGLGS